MPALVVVLSWASLTLPTPPSSQKHVSCRPLWACLQPGYVTPGHENYHKKFSLMMSNTQDPVLPSTLCVCEVKRKGSSTQCAFSACNSGEATEQPGIHLSLAFFQVTWCLERCTTCSPWMPSSTGMGHQCTRSRDPSTGSRRHYTLFATSCTVHRWSGKTPMWSPQKSRCRLRGKSLYTVLGVVVRCFVNKSA